MKNNENSLHESDKNVLNETPNNDAEIINNIFDEIGDDDDEETPVKVYDREEIVSDNSIYVSFATFIEIKYGVVTLEELNKCPDVVMIVTNYTLSVALERKLAAENRISDEVTEDEKLRISEFAKYPDYVGQRSVITLTLEKVILVAAKVFSGFSYKQEAMSSLFSFMYNGEQFSLNLKQLIEKLRELYVAVGKSMLVLEFANGYNEDVANLFIAKRYAQAKVTVPNHLVSLRPTMINKIPWSSSPYMSTKSISLVSNILIDQGTTVPEPTIKPGDFAPAKKKFSNRSAHGIEDMLNLNYTKDEENNAMGEAIAFIFSDKNLGVDFVNVLSAYDEQNQGRMLPNVESQAMGEFNLGWYSVSLTKTDSSSRSKQQYKNACEQKFSTTPCVFLYTAYPVSYMFFDNAKGRTYPSAAILLQYLNVLPKFYHYLTLIIQMHTGSRAELIAYCQSVCTHMADKMTSKPQMRKRITAQFMINVLFWVRTIVITKFAQVKNKYLPSRVIKDDGDDSVEETDNTNYSLGDVNVV